MPRPPSATVSDLLALLRGEPAPAAWLVQQLGVTKRGKAQWRALGRVLQQRVEHPLQQHI